MPYTGKGVIEDGIADKLLATSAVTALTSTRVYVRLAPEQATFPYVVVSKQAAEMHNAGAAAGRGALEYGTVMVNCYGSTYESARNVANEITKAIDHQSGTWGVEEVMACFCETHQDISQAPTQDDEIGYPGVGMTFKTIYRIPL